MTDLSSQLKQDGLSHNIINSALILYVTDKQRAMEMFRLRETKDNILASRGRIFYLPNSSGEHEGMFAEFIDHITPLRI
jgi:hypothetical protein